MSLDTENQGVVIPGESGASTPAPANDREPSSSVAEADGDNGDVESRARAMGWVPQDDFRGDPDKWRDAETFVKKGEEDLPVLRENLRRATSKLTELEKRIQERDRQYQTNIDSLERMTSVALQRQRDQIAASYAAAQRQAVELGDTQRFDQLRADEAQALYNLDAQAFQARQPPPPPPVRGPAPEEVPIVERWKAENPWFLHDPEMNQVAQLRHVQLGRENPNMPLEQNLAEVAKYMRQRYADRFPQQTMRAAGVEGGSRMASASAPRGRGVADLPADAKRQADKFIAQGLFKDHAEYARDYWSQQ